MLMCQTKGYQSSRLESPLSLPPDWQGRRMAVACVRVRRVVVRVRARDFGNAMISGTNWEKKERRDDRVPLSSSLSYSPSEEGPTWTPLAKEREKDGS